MIFTRHLNHYLIGFIVLLALATLKLTLFYSFSAFHFSLHLFLAPLIGLVAGNAFACFYFVVKLIIHALTASTVYNFLSLCSLPSFCAGLYLSQGSCHKYTIDLTKRLCFSFLIALCMGLFISQTYNTSACLYATFWIVPLVTLWLPHRKLFVHMLGSTFTAHAVGSVLWLFFGPSFTSSAWVELMPLVLFERLALTCSMWLSYHVIIAGKNSIISTKQWQSLFLRKTA